MFFGPWMLWYFGRAGIHISFGHKRGALTLNLYSDACVTTQDAGFLPSDIIFLAGLPVFGPRIFHGAAEVAATVSAAID